MSQGGILNIHGGGTTVVGSLTGNSGGAVPPTGSNINTIGGGSITIVGNPGLSTLTTQLTGLTNHNVLVGAGTSTITKVPPLTAGFVLTSNGPGADPSFQSVAASGAIIDVAVQTGTSPIAPTIAGLITINGATVAAGSNPVRTDGTGANTMAVEVQISQAIAATDATKIGLANFNSANFTVDANGFVSLLGTDAIQTITGNSGGAESPLAGNFNIVGTGSITVAGTANTETVQLTGLTNHAVLVGAGTATITKVGPSASTGQILQNNAAADPSYSTATYPSTTTINQILYSSAANVVNGLATANQGVLTTGTTGIPVITAIATNGQLIIGSTAGAPAAATLSAGTGISITNGSNSITIAATGAGLTWTDATGATQALIAENGYVTDRGGGVVYTLPASGTLGDEITIVGKLGLATITPNANQQILIGSASGTVGITGTAVSNNVGDCITLICITAGASTVWRANSVVGTWTLN